MMSDYEIRAIKTCIQTMQDACDLAVKRLEHSQADNENALEVASGVMNIFTWGWANASTNLETAIHAFNRELKREEWKRQKEQGK